jgi:hypothetical protein
MTNQIRNSKFEIRKRESRALGISAPTLALPRSTRGGEKRGLGFRILWALVVLVSVCALGQVASPTPFYYASATSYDAQCKTLIVGANQSLGQAIVSSDHKYVTLDMDAGLLGSAGVRNFSYQRGGRGFVGSGTQDTGIGSIDSAGKPAGYTGEGNTGVENTGEGAGLTPSIKTSPDEIAPELSVLDKPGMILIAPLER